MNHQRGYYLGFLYFIYAYWEDEDVYTILDFSKIFNIEVRLTRYYLMKLVHNHKIAIIKHGKNNYYIKRWAVEGFDKFISMKNLRIIR